MLDHNYGMAALHEACDEDVIEEMVETRSLINEHTPLPSPNPKKSKKSNSNEQETEVSNKSIFQAVQAVLKKFVEQDKRLKTFESRIEGNTKAVKENQEEIEKIKKQMDALSKEKNSLKEMCLENVRYKRRWNRGIERKR